MFLFKSIYNVIYGAGIYKILIATIANQSRQRDHMKRQNNQSDLIGNSEQTRANISRREWITISMIRTSSLFQLMSQGNKFRHEWDYNGPRAKCVTSLSFKVLSVQPKMSPCSLWWSVEIMPVLTSVFLFFNISCSINSQGPVLVASHNTASGAQRGHSINPVCRYIKGNTFTLILVTVMPRMDGCNS